MLAGLLALASFQVAFSNPEDPDKHKRRMELHEYALSGDLGSMYQLANFYYLQKEHKLAIQWYKKAAKEDHIPSLWRLVNYPNKNGKKELYQIAHKSLKNLIALEQYKAFSRLADLYADKDSPYYDIKQALIYYEDGVNLNDTIAMMKLAHYHLGYFGGKIDYRLALPYILKAGEHRVAEAIRLHGMYYRYGLGGFSIDQKEAWKKYYRAAQLGDVQSMYDIAEALYKGKELKKNHKLSKMYFERASERGLTDAAIQLKSLKFEE